MTDAHGGRRDEEDVLETQTVGNRRVGGKKNLHYEHKMYIKGSHVKKNMTFFLLCNL